MEIITKKQALELGLKRYFTGKKCKQGHVSERYVSKSTCIQCAKESVEKRIDEIRERQREKYHSRTDDKKIADRKVARENARKRYSKNPDKYRAISRKFREKNLEYCQEKSREYKELNRESINERRRKKYAENPEFYKEVRRKNYKRNAESCRAYARAYQSKNLKYYGKLNADRLYKINKATPPWANMEKIKEIYYKRPKGMHVDHIVPITSKIVCGLHCEQNLQYLTAEENTAKSNRHWPDMP